MLAITMLKGNVRENRSDNDEWTTHRNWQYWAHKTENEYKENKYIASLFII